MNWKHWTHGLVSALITGLTTSLMSALGINGADAVGAEVAKLDMKQIGIITVIGGVVGAAAYLRQSPIPPDNQPEVKS